MVRSLTAAAIAVALTMPMPAMAQQSRSEARLAACKATATTAETIMRARQSGVPVVKVIESIQVPGVPDGPAKDDALRFVQEAYGEPAWNSPDMQRKAITDFGAAKYVECMAR